MPQKPVLLVIHGAPGVGKTTLLRKLSKDLGLPGIGKDDIKELLSDHLGTGDREWSKDLGAATADMVFSLLRTWLGRGHDLIIESAFYHTFAADEIRQILAQYPCTFLEIYCTLDPAIRKQRFINRAKSGARHPVHVDSWMNDLTDEDVQQRYAPLAVGGIVEVDTAEFGVAHYAALLRYIKHFLRT